MIKELERSVNNNKDLYEDLLQFYPNAQTVDFKFSAGHKILFASIAKEVKKMGERAFLKGVDKTKSKGRTPTYSVLKAKLVDNLAVQYQRFDLNTDNLDDDYNLELNVDQSGWHLKVSFKCQRCNKWLSLSYSKNKNGSFCQYKFSNFVRHYNKCGAAGVMNIGSDDDDQEMPSVDEAPRAIASVIVSHLGDL